jgi:hypothetical protein
LLENFRDRRAADKLVRIRLLAKRLDLLKFFAPQIVNATLEV